MPPRTTRSTRRGGAAAASKGGKQQQPISFGTARVTKPGVKSGSGKNDKKAEEKAAALERAGNESAIPPPSVAQVLVDNDEQAEDTDRASTAASITLDTSELTIREQRRQEAEAKSAAAGQETTRSAEEEAAARVTETQIKKYWAGKEAERTTRRVHQEGLTLYDKVLREFDMSSQFGNCMGIARTQRWKLAHDLGLDPPLEVLAVLVRKDKDANIPAVQRAYPDVLMATRFEIS